MPVLKIISIGLRVCQLAAAGVIVGIFGSQLHDYHKGSTLPYARFMYIAIIAGISCLLGLLWLLPFKGGFAHWPVDIILSFAWFAAFGIIWNWISNGDCKGDKSHTIGLDNNCDRSRATEAFSILSGVLWLLSAIVGLWFMHRESRKKKKETVVTTTVSQGA